MQEMGVWSLGQKDPLEKEIATRSSFPAWEIPWTEEPGSYSSWDHRVGHNWATKKQQQIIDEISSVTTQDKIIPGDTCV